MIYRINERVNFVKGYKNGAIYDFTTGKVYSINDLACNTLKSYCDGHADIASNAFLKQLRDNCLIDYAFAPVEWKSEKSYDITLEMAWIEVTQVCNLKCVHCYEGNNHEGYKDILSLSEWKKIIDQLAAESIKRLVIIGGEPCCHKDIKEIIKYAATYPFDTTIFTNATMIDEDLFNTIVESGIRVKISVYGPNATVHDHITQIQGSFDKLVRNVRRFKEHNVDVTASIVLMKENEEFIDQTIEFVKSIGMNFKKYDVIRNVYGGTQKEHAPVTQKALDYAYFKKPNFWTNYEQFEKSNRVNTCWYGKIAIMENGNVIPCEFERNCVYGNVRNNTIHEILHNDITADNWFLYFERIEVCKDCEYRYACKDCRALGLSVCGSKYSKNPRCLYDPYNGVWNENGKSVDVEQ